ncbi:ABC transporter ATP-binding protein [Neptunitalea lumnitzerae]|uniref:ABC transporter ATP-binding protein n=1 Tax=Neptunitalea lumnitzerae TaxID=2965509 RepID=A0ABQ5MF21_9FLAO|nr:ABC transporter ATP-binding protein [Neptunitalea sp. Y10]GLB48019.1 ABC transporter ATP-binding protein [Neptunitalea sp. Y10]
MLNVANISFSYNEKPILKNLSFNVQQGEHIAVVGESGCGKSTLLKCLYGLFDLDAGEMFYNETQILGPAYHLVPGMDFMKYLAQDFDLMPFITVAENIGKYLSNFYKEEKQQRIKELLDMVEMTPYANVKAKLLSGGQMQRVALARAIAREPKVLLLDEPFSHIDSFQKNRLRRNLFQHLKQANITCIVATHDKEESLPFADKILVMKAGEALSFSTPKEVYNNPKNTYTAALFGDINVLNGKDFGKTEKEIICYPHQLHIVPENGTPAMVKECYYRGADYLVIAELQNGQRVFVESKEPYTTDANIALNLLTKQ